MNKFVDYARSTKDLSDSTDFEKKETSYFRVKNNAPTEQIQPLGQPFWISVFCYFAVHYLIYFESMVTRLQTRWSIFRSQSIDRPRLTPIYTNCCDEWLAVAMATDSAVVVFQSKNSSWIIIIGLLIELVYTTLWSISAYSHTYYSTYWCVGTYLLLHRLFAFFRRSLVNANVSTVIESFNRAIFNSYSARNNLIA